MTSPDARAHGRSQAELAEKLTVAAFGALIGFGCVLRFWKLGEEGLWYDELWTVVGASDRPFMEMYREWMVGDPHPPGYFLFYYAWLSLVPDDELWARLPNAVAGVLTVSYLLFGARSVLSRDERMYAAALASFSWLYLFYAVNVKQYSATLLLVTIATITYLEIVGRRRLEGSTRAVFAATLVALAYLDHFGMAYACALLALLAITFRGTPAVLRSLGTTAIIFAVAYLPIAYFLQFPLLYSENVQGQGVTTFLAEVLPSLFFSDTTFVAGSLVVLAAAGALTVLRGGPHVDLRSSRNRHVLLILTTFAGLLLLVSLVEPILVVRYFIVLFPVTLIGLAILAAAAFPASRAWPCALPLVFFARAAVVDFRAVDGMQRQDWDAGVDRVSASAGPADPVYVLGADPERPMLDYLEAGDVDGALYRQNVRFFEYYFRRRGADDIADRLQVVEPTAQSAGALAETYRQSGKTVHILAGHHIQLYPGALWALERAATSLETTWLYSTIVYEVTF